MPELKKKVFGNYLATGGAVDFPSCAGYFSRDVGRTTYRSQPSTTISTAASSRETSSCMWFINQRRRPAGCSPVRPPNMKDVAPVLPATRHAGSCRLTALGTRSHAVRHGLTTYSDRCRPARAAPAGVAAAVTRPRHVRPSVCLYHSRPPS